MLRCSTVPEPQPAAENGGRAGGRAGAPGAGGIGKPPEPGSVKRRALDDEEPCPICYEEMAGVDPELLVWCKVRRGGWSGGRDG